MKSGYRLLIFDWDGTLMDSQSHIVASMQAAMADLGLEMLDARTISDIIGLGMREALLALFPERPDAAFFTAFTDRYRQHYFRPDAPQTLFADAEVTLKTLRQEGYLLAVATGKGRHGLNKVLTETGLGALFDAHRCAEETASKPDPKMVHEILHTLAVAAEDALMIGDSEYDLQMAHNAGIDSIAVTYGVHETERLLRYDPLTCLDRLGDLPRFLSSATPPAANRGE